jgi:hypothetical protein
MRNTFRTLTALFLSFLACLSGLPAQAQSTRILDGSYVTKFGRNRNFVINPDAQVAAIDGTTRTNTTLTRSTTTPISENGSTEFNLTFNSSTNSLDFNTAGATQGNLGGMMCEVGFRGRGFQSTTSLQAYDGTNVLASYNFGLLSNTTEVSVPFPCPLDPSTMRVRITDSATLSGTNEIAGVYFGRARNFGDAANLTAWTAYTPTFVAFGTVSNVAMYWRRVGTDIEVEGRFTCGTSTAGGAAMSLPSGLTSAVHAASLYAGEWRNDNAGASVQKNGSLVTSPGTDTLNFGIYEYTRTSGSFTTVSGTTICVSGYVIGVKFKTPISNWPAASSAVAPGNQNVYGTAKWRTALAVPTTTGASFTTVNDALFSSPTLAGQASATSASCGAANDLGVCFATLPAGTYHVIINADMYSSFTATGTQCQWSIYDGTSYEGGVATYAASGEEHVSSLSGTFTYTTQQTNIAFRLRYYRGTGGGSCSIVSQSASERNPNIIVRRIDTSNSQPVLVQSPTKAAATGTAPIAGEVDEYNGVSGSLTSLVSTTYSTTGAQVTTTTGGCFDAWAVCLFDPAATTTVTLTQCAVSRVGVSLSDALLLVNYSSWSFNGTAPNSGGDFGYQYESPRWRTCSASPITFYGVMYANFSTSTMQGTARVNYRRVGDR